MKQQGADLLLRDFKPQSMWHVPVHNIERARFPVIDIHNHVNDAWGREHMPVERVVEIMNQCNVEKIVILTEKRGTALQKAIDEMVKPYPNRFLVLTQIDGSKIADPNFSPLMVRQLDDARRDSGLQYGLRLRPT